MGKPPTELEVNPKSAFSVGVSVDRDRLSALPIDLSGEVLARHRTALGQLDLQKTVLPLLVSATERLLEGYAVPKQQLLGISKQHRRIYEATP